MTCLPIACCTEKSTHTKLPFSSDPVACLVKLYHSMYHFVYIPGSMYALVCVPVHCNGCTFILGFDIWAANGKVGVRWFCTEEVNSLIQQLGVGSISPFPRETYMASWELELQCVNLLPGKLCKRQNTNYKTSTRIYMA